MLPDAVEVRVDASGRWIVIGVCFGWREVRRCIWDIGKYIPDAPESEICLLLYEVKVGWGVTIKVSKLSLQIKCADKIESKFVMTPGSYCFVLPILFPTVDLAWCPGAGRRHLSEVWNIVPWVQHQPGGEVPIRGVMGGFFDGTAAMLAAN